MSKPFIGEISLMGHGTIFGLIAEATIAGVHMVEVKQPNYDLRYSDYGNGNYRNVLSAFTGLHDPVYYSHNAIYSITPSKIQKFDRYKYEEFESDLPF